MCSNFLQPCITEPARIVGNNRPALIDNIVINTYKKNFNSGNITEIISDNMPNFVIIRESIDKKEQCLKYLENIKNLDIV